MPIMARTSSGIYTPVTSIYDIAEHKISKVYDAAGNLVYQGFTPIDAKMQGKTQAQASYTFDRTITSVPSDTYRYKLIPLITVSNPHLIQMGDIENRKLTFKGRKYQSATWSGDRGTIYHTVTVSVGYSTRTTTTGTLSSISSYGWVTIQDLKLETSRDVTRTVNIGTIGSAQKNKYLALLVKQDLITAGSGPGEFSITGTAGVGLASKITIG